MNPDPTGTPAVAPLDAFGADDLPLVGGKAANLGELRRAGLPVPDGFVVTTEAYAAVAESVGLGDLVRSMDRAAPEGSAPPARSGDGPVSTASAPASMTLPSRKGVPDDRPGAEGPRATPPPGPEGSLAPEGHPLGGPWPEELRAAVTSAPVPDELRRSIARAYERLGPDVAVAVRSSATAEDLPGAAFAGQQDTYLNVVGADAVVAAVRCCWASLWTDRAVAYRRERAVDQAEVRIAVVVQEMVDSEVAGVMFTADPVSGARDRIVVDAASGLGESVVSGLVTPDHYLLDQRGRVMEWTPGRDEVVIRSVTGGGVHHAEAPGRGGGTDRGAPVRSGRPAETGAGAADSADGPDSPGSRRALLSGDQLTILAAHARTIAAHFGRPQDIEWALSDQRFRIVQSRPMTALPPPPTPLNRRQRLQASILTEYLPTRPYPMDVSTWLGRGPAAMMREITEYYGLAGAFTDYLREEEGVVVQLVPPSPRPTPRMVLTPWKLVRKARRFRSSEWTADPRLAGFLEEADALDAQDPAALTWAALVRVPDQALALMGPCRDLRIDYLPGSGLALARMALAAAVLGHRSLLPDLMGGARTRTEDSNEALRALADRARAVPELYRLFTERQPAEILGALCEEGAETAYATFRTELDAYLREYGRRETTSPLLVSPPTLAESPEVVLGLVRSLLAREGQPGAGTVSRSSEARRRMLGHPLLRGHRARARVERWLREAQDGVALREDTHFYFTASLPALRRALLEIGDRLHRADVLAEPSDVFHLRMEEVLEVRDVEAIPTAQADRLRSLVRARAAKRAELAGVAMIDPAEAFPRGGTGDALVTGAPASSGRVSGPVRIVRGAEDFPRLRDGDVLVCPYTNPAWTPLFQRAAAVVVDSGAIASHAAIVAREYGIPAVMGTGTGTTVLTDGEPVTVDGGSGRVTRPS